MTDAIEAGARAIIKCRRESPYGWASSEEIAKACIEAAIASGALVPATEGKSDTLAAVAEMRERCAKAASDYDGDGLTGSGYEDQLGDARQTQRDIVEAIRQLDIAPACGDYVVVPREPTEADVKDHLTTANVVVPRAITEAMIDAFFKARDEDFPKQMQKARETGSGWDSLPCVVWTALLHAATRTGGAK